MRGHVIALVILWLLALVVRLDATRLRTSAGHGDVAAYYQVSRNLYEGRGFVQDFVADRLASPVTLPTPSNTWWRPLPSILGWLGMEVAGDSTYEDGKRAMIFVASFIPWVAYAAALLLLASRWAAFAAGLLAVGFHLYLDQPNQILSHGPYGLTAGAALVMILGVERSTRHLAWFGVLFGLAYLSRGDSQVLPILLGVALLAARVFGDRTAVPWRRLGVAAGLFVLIAAPWWARNFDVYDAPMPPGQSKAAYAKTYEDWFRSPDRLTWERYEAWGSEKIWQQKRRSVADAASFVPLAMSRSVDRGKTLGPDAPARRLQVLGLYVLGPLLWLGFAWLLIARRRAALLVLLHLTALVVLYAVGFSAIGRNSFHSSLFSVYPVFLACIVAAIQLLLRPLGDARARLRDGLTVAIAVVVAGLNVWAARPHLAAKYRGVENMLTPYRALAGWVDEHRAETPVIFCRNPWQLSAEARIGAVMIPLADAEEIRRVARTFGVTHLVDELRDPKGLVRIRPGLEAMFAAGELKRIKARAGFPLYQLLLPER